VLPQKYYEDFKVGDKFTTQSVTVTEAHVINFACLTGDWNPLHVDEEWCKKNSMFGTRVAHGPLTFALSLGLGHLAGFIQHSAMAFLGIDNLRAKLPVLIGDTIHLEAEVIDMRETRKPDRGIFQLRYTIKNQRDEVVMEYDLSLMMPRRQGRQA